MKEKHNLVEIMYDISGKDEDIWIGHTEIHATQGRQWRYSSEDIILISYHKVMPCRN